MTLNGRRTIEVELPEFLIRSLQYRVVENNRDASPEEQVDFQFTSLEDVRRQRVARERRAVDDQQAPPGLLARKGGDAGDHLSWQPVEAVLAGANQLGVAGVQADSPAGLMKYRFDVAGHVEPSVSVTRSIRTYVLRVASRAPNRIVLGARRASDTATRSRRRMWSAGPSSGSSRAASRRSSPRA